jgi:hypothetical protein
VVNNLGTIIRLQLNGGPFAPDGDGSDAVVSALASASAGTAVTQPPTARVDLRREGEGHGASAARLAALVRYADEHRQDSHLDDALDADVTEELEPLDDEVLTALARR